MAASVNIGSLSKRPLDSTRHSLHSSVGCGRRVRSPLKSCTSVRKRVRLRHSEEPSSTSTSLRPLIGQLGFTCLCFILFFSLTLLCCTQNTHTRHVYRRRKATRRHSASQTFRVHLKVASLFLRVCCESASHFHTGDTRQDPPPIFYPECITIRRSSADMKLT